MARDRKPRFRELDGRGHRLRAAISVRQIRKLRLLATVHPAILDQIGAGDMPKEQELRTIASASREDQAAVWKKSKPRKGEGALWWQIAQALQKTRFFARDAKFGEAEREAFGIVWQEDLFAEGDEDNRFTIDGEAFVSAQRAWVDANMPKNGVLIEIDEYGREKLPPGRTAPGRSRRKATRSALRSIRATARSTKWCSASPSPT